MRAFGLIAALVFLLGVDTTARADDKPPEVCVDFCACPDDCADYPGTTAASVPIRDSFPACADARKIKRRIFRCTPDPKDTYTLYNFKGPTEMEPILCLSHVGCARVISSEDLTPFFGKRVDFTARIERAVRVTQCKRTPCPETELLRTVILDSLNHL